jgi:hypothetical protein
MVTWPSLWVREPGQALIRRDKTDAEGQGRVAYLSRETVRGRYFAG